MIILYCPKCHKILLKILETEGKIVLEVLCPYCQTLLKIENNPKIEILVSKENSKKI